MSIYPVNFEILQVNNFLLSLPNCQQSFEIMFQQLKYRISLTKKLGSIEQLK